MDADRAAYLRAIEDVFFEIRGRGFMLSPRDVALAEEWRQAGVPVRVVGRALLEGARSWAERNPQGASPPASLAYFRGHVERAASVVRERSVGAGGGAVRDEATRAQRRVDTGKALADAVVRAGKAQPDEAIKGVLRSTWRQVEQGLAAGDEVWGLAERLDREMCDAALQVATDAVRAAVDAAAESAVTPERAATMSPRAVQNRREAARVAAIRDTLGLPDLITVLRDADA